MVQNDQDQEIHLKKLVPKQCVDDKNEKATEIKSDQEAPKMAEKILEYARFRGNEKLSLVLSNSTDLLQEIVIRNQKQSSLYEYFLRNTCN